MKSCREGDRVKSATSFLTRIQMPTSDPMWKMRGTVVGVKEYAKLTIARVKWDDGREASSLIQNLDWLFNEGAT